MYPEIDKNKFKSGLYIVSTPIGNLGDITIRALETLKNSSFIICEDTRVSKKLLSKFKIKKKLIPNHKFSENRNLDKIMNILYSGKLVSIISDAGTPTISDPGRILIQKCIENKVNIYPIPGPSSVIAAISVSGFSDKYYFHGFLPKKKNEIEKDFTFLSNLKCSIIFFISPNKFKNIIYMIEKYFYDRNILICREVTKYYEEYLRSSVKKLKELKINIKGEMTIVISDKDESKKLVTNLTESDKKKIQKLINKMSLKDIVNIFSDEKNVPKKEIYNYCLYLKNEK